MTIQLSPEQERLLQEAIKNGFVRSVDEFIDIAIAMLPQPTVQNRDSRLNAIRGMEEFGDKYRLNFEKPITRRLFHEDHRR